MNTGEIAEKLSQLIQKQPADYIEAHVEEGQASYLTYRGQELETAGYSKAQGGNIRALVKGGWGFVSFNDASQLEEKVALAVRQAKLASQQQSHFAPAPVVKEEVPPPFEQTPLDIPLDTKKALLDEYQKIIWQTPQIQTSVVGYTDSHRVRYYLNSEGSFIRQERADINLRLNAVASRNGSVQQSGLSLGSLGNFSAITGLHQEVSDMAGRAVTMLDAPRVKGGNYTVVLDPVLAGVFVHEAFGHLSEADFVYENQSLREIMVLGKEFGSAELNIVDDPTWTGLRGSYLYDDEGTPATKAYLILEGKLVGRLHSCETANRMGEAPSGHARALNYAHPPIVRMGNTYIEPGRLSFEEIIGDIKDGIYAKNWYGGTTQYGDVHLLRR